MNVLILNTVALNGGDGAILIALLDGLRAQFGAATRFVVHEARPDVAVRYYSDIAFRPTVWSALGRFPRTRLGALRQRAMVRTLLMAARGGGAGAVARRLLPESAVRALRDYQWADVVVTTGGTYLVEHYGLTDRLLSFDVALATGKPLVFYTQSLGPFRAPAARRAMERVLSRAALVLLRDSLSMQHVVDLGGRTDHVHVVPDCVFSLADPTRLTAASTARRTGDHPLRIAISVRDWRHFATRDSAEGMREYLDAICAVTTHVVERYGARVTFLSTCQGIPEYAHDDSRTARAVVERLPEHVWSAVRLDGSFHPPRQLLEELSTFDLVLATRMHVAILSLSAGVPVVPIAYEFKTRELFAGLGYAGGVHDIEQVQASALIASVEELLADEGGIRASLFAAVADSHARAVTANDHVGAVVRCRAVAIPTTADADGRLALARAGD